MILTSVLNEDIYLPIFLDVHSIGTTTEKDLISAQNAPRDELGVKVVNILYNFEGGTIYCLLDAPNNEAVDWIMEVKLLYKSKIRWYLSSEQHQITRLYVAAEI